MDPYTINPADLQMNNTSMFEFDPFDTNCCSPIDDPSSNHLSAVDSAVDLASGLFAPVKHEPSEDLYQFCNIGESPAATNTPSPSNDMIFSNSNSPGDFVRDLSQTSSPETTSEMQNQDVEVSPNNAWGSMYSTSDAILIPQSRDLPRVFLIPDKTKTRAETQIKMQLTLDPLENMEYICFPRKTLAKPKHFASEEEKSEIESKGEILHMDVLLVCATAVEKADDRERALRRAAGKEKVPRRGQTIPISELDRDDPAHPQNGGEVLICEGCKERERKRYDRKKKRTEDEEEFSKYENDRVIMINEKEYKKWKEVESGDQQFSPRAKQIDFAMRIACYCRHQEEKTPMGYRVIFTFTDSQGNLVAQHLSDVFHITDDHKNKEVAPEAIPRPLTIPQPYMAQYPHASNVVVPMYSYPVENQYSSAMGPYSQPPTPVMSTFQSPMSPMETTFNQTPASTVAPQASRQAAPAFSAPSASTTTAAQYARHQRGQSYYDQPMLSPTTQINYESHLPRPQSLDNFNFNFSADNQFSQSQNQYFASAPPSAVSTPINLSRPASPTWEQGPQKKGKTLRCVYFYVDE